MKPQLIDAYGRPLKGSVLTEEVMAATLGGVRSPISGYPGDGLNPERLASILREADRGDPVRYMELAETVEERDLHYVGVLGTRRRSVSQIDISVEAADDSADAERHAQTVRDWLKRDELQTDLFDILDCIGKGYSGTEIIWDTSEGDWMPARLELRDPRWFRFADHDLTTPMRLDDNGQKVPLEPAKFIWSTIKAKSGLPLRSGLARIVAWAWMFKAYTQRDWAIFTQTYGQPVRVGKWGSGASEDDKKTLFRAVANIAGDMAAIIPDSMQIEFVESGNVGAASGNYKERSDWLDMQVSKAVLGQTATTDAVTGGLGSGKEHRQVQEDIERADARALSGILNRDLIKVWMALRGVPAALCPRLKIERPESEDLSAFATAVTPFIDRGLPVSRAAIYAKFGLPEPKPGEEVLRPTGANSAPMPDADASDTPPEGAASPIKRVSGEIKRVARLSGTETAVSAQAALAGDFPAPDPVALLSDRLALEAAPEMERLIAQIEAMAGAATSLEELREMMLAAFPDLATADLARVIARGMLAANLGGRVAVAEDE
jgi:phage gp29-like protein